MINTGYNAVQSLRLLLLPKYRRVSCEAIPEEISGMGTTPPSTENAGEHPPGLLSQRSYPGASQVPPSTTSTTTSNTVPPSPTATQVIIISFIVLPLFYVHNYKFN